MSFAKKHNKRGLKKMQDNDTKAMSARAEAFKALVKLKEVQKSLLTGSSCKLSHLSYIAHTKLGKYAHARIVKGLRLCRPKAKKARLRPRPKPRPGPQLQLHLQFRLQLRLPKGVQVPTKAL
ncbi:60S ribosomal protein L29 [Tupaia chinensis]|uniref:60S ribosomal protein L29 n=1 Tax=Tupaia chinensis TaxID=246437 RepID=L8Y2N5_TUPCH|nr:60S ribosomal protein L29 [Tupaia chinensis]